MNYETTIERSAGGPIQKLTRLLAAPIIEPSQRAARIQAVERDIVLPLRFLIVAILGYYFFFSQWFDTPGAATASDWGLHNASALKAGFIAYASLNAAMAVALIWARHLSLAKIQWMVFLLGVMDGAMMGTLTFLTNPSGFDSNLYWVFPALIVHNAISIPVAFPQLLLNFLVSGAFLVGGILDHRINIRPPSMDVEGQVHENPVERMIVLIAWALCCYGIQVLFEKQKLAEAEATEFAVRQERLRTAGRLAAEIAHQIKNPLGIITNAAFCLQRTVGEGEAAVDEQIQIIREEVNRADQIITELMGYAQLAEGQVERLVVTEELDNAVQEVFPPAAKYPVKIHKNYEAALPALLMQKRHLGGVLVNLLQNAREAMNGRGEIEISTKYGENDSIRILIADNGPGIAPDKIDKIFEAYFTTREKGTGLGLAIVKHNTEMYGGTVKVQSELGKGTQFALEFPARILMRLSK
ncbi:MAG TPA: ATP-binding protein [Candidatus Baltobacteraceae bacterium]|nr:ATP-binding protein [Candidatus Baltobacteraceae bacterium]